MAAPKNNTNAEKWTLADAKTIYAKAFELAKRKCNYTVGSNTIKGYEFDFIGELTEELDVYRRLVDRDLPDRFPECKELFNRLKQRMEVNCYYNTKRGIIKEGTGLVNLKSNHGWKDRSEVEVNASVNVNPKQWVQ